MGTISLALRRPQTYVGHAREAASVIACLARFPFGMGDRPLTSGHPRGDGHDVPVVLVHGFAHNRSGWYVLERTLRARGFSSVHTLNYNPWRSGVALLAEQLARRVEQVRILTGAPKVHLVGHSLGGILARVYVDELGGDEVVDTAVTVATPHEGTVAARIAWGPVAPELLPGSVLVRRLAARARPTSVRWVALYSNLDLLVQPARSAMLRPPALQATNILIKDHGHLAMMISPVVARSIAHQLETGRAALSATA